MRRWRGNIDVPPLAESLQEAQYLGEYLELDIVYHDHLSRCAQTALALDPTLTVESEGPRPWHMGPGFEGREVTPESITVAQWFVEHPGTSPAGGEPFGVWLNHWLGWITRLKKGFAGVGIVTHNRNIQALYSMYEGEFIPKMYNVDGPGFLTVHFYKDGHIAPWNGKATPPGIYLIRHAATEWGT